MDLIPFGWDPFGKAGSAPSVDIQENNKEVIVMADIPGIDPQKMLIEMDDERFLRLSGKVEEEKESKDKNFYRKERSVRSFHRTIQLPCPVSSEGVKATAKNGILTVVLPKRNPEKLTMKKIPVEEA